MPPTSLSVIQNKYLPYMLAFALFMQILDVTILNTALPVMGENLNVSALNMQWVVISYALTLAVFIPVSGYLADKYGTQRIFSLAILLFSVGSLCCAVSQSLNQLVVARIVQGIGGAMMTPVARLVLVKSYPREKLLTVMNYAVIPALIAPVLGPLMGGYIVEYASWPWIFLINLPVAAVAFWVGLKLMPNYTEPVSSFDWWGFLLIAGAATALTFSVEFIAHPNAVVMSSWVAVLGLMLLFAYYRYAQDNSRALFPLDLFEVRTFRIGIVANIFTRLGIAAIPFLLPLMLQLGHGFSPSASGWMLVPIALGAMVIKPFVSPLVQRTSYRFILISNTFLLALLQGAIAFFSTLNHWPLFALLMLFVGISNSLQYSVMNTLTIGDLKRQQASSGNSLMTVNQQLSIGLGIALAAAILNVWVNYLPQCQTIKAFEYTYIIMGVITFVSGLYFFKLKRSDGEGLY